MLISSQKYSYIRMSDPKVFLCRTKTLTDLVALAHSHVVKGTKDRSQPRTFRNRLELSMQLPTRILEMFDHKFVPFAGCPKPFGRSLPVHTSSDTAVILWHLRSTL